MLAFLHRHATFLRSLGMICTTMLVTIGGILAIQKQWFRTLYTFLGAWFWPVLLGAVSVSVGSACALLIPRYRERLFIRRGKQTGETVPPEPGHYLRNRLQTAIRDQRTAPGFEQYGRRALYARPWYLLLGASQAGKTTLLTQVARQFFPHVRPSASPPGECVWWPFPGVTVLDTPGSFVFPEAEVRERERQHLYRLLRLLARERLLQPLNRVMVAVAADHLLEQWPDNRLTLQHEGADIRRRLHEITQELYLRFPVYLLITRCDRLPGFVEFFAPPDVPEAGIKQVFQDNKQHVLGYCHDFSLDRRGKHVAAVPTIAFTDQTSPAAQTVSFDQEIFLPLLQDVRQLRGTLFSHDTLPAPALHLKLFGFPQQFQALHEPLKLFMESVLQSGPDLHDVFFRGLFFTSAGPQDTPPASAQGETPTAAPPRSETTASLVTSRPTYFLHDLFTIILPRDIGYARLTRRARWYRLARHLCSLLGCLVLLSILGGLGLRDFFSNRQVQAAVPRDACTAAATVPLDTMERCRQAVTTLASGNQERRRTLSGLLFRESFRVEQDFRQRYVERFTSDVLAPLDQAMAQRMRQGGEVFPLVSVLMARLTVLQQCLNATACPEAVTARFQEDDYALMLQGLVPSPTTQQVALFGTLYRAYLLWVDDPATRLTPQHTAYTAWLREWFATPQLPLQHMRPWINKLYQKNTVTAAECWPKTLAAVGQPAAKVEGGYTRSAWEDRIQPLLQQMSIVVPALAPELRAFEADYRLQYVGQWERFLRAFPRDETTWSPTQQRQALEVLLGPESPYNCILDVTLGHLQPMVPAAPTADATPTSPPPPSAAGSVPDWVRLLRQYAASPKRPEYLKTLQALRPTLFGPRKAELSFKLARDSFEYDTSGAGLAASAAPPPPVLHQLQRMLQELRQEAGPPGQEAPLWPLLERPLRLVWPVVLQEASEQLQARWQDEVEQPSRRLQGIERLEFLHGPQGKVKTFVEGVAKPFVVGTGARPGSALGKEIAVPPQILQSVKRDKDMAPLLAMRQQQGGKYSVRVAAGRSADISKDGVNVNEKATELAIECDGKIYRVSNRPQESASQVATIPWSFERCGDVEITVTMACNSQCVEYAGYTGNKVAETDNLLLSKRYQGAPGFWRFTQDFQSGSSELTPADAKADGKAVGVQSEATLHKYRVKKVRVFYEVTLPPALRELLVLLAES